MPRPVQTLDGKLKSAIKTLAVATALDIPADQGEVAGKVQDAIQSLKEALSLRETFTTAAE